MAHLKSTKQATVNITATKSVVCYPEISIGVLQKPDGSYAAYGTHFYTEDEQPHTILHFEEPLTEATVNHLAGLTDTSGMTETERRHAQLIVGAKAILTQKNHWSLSGQDYEEVTTANND